MVVNAKSTGENSSGGRSDLEHAICHDVHIGHSLHSCRAGLGDARVDVGIGAVRYTGLPEVLKAEVFARDAYRCRWCGVQRSWLGFDPHHIEYRRGTSADVIDNLITLCRTCHNYVHDSYKIPKETAQAVLFELITTPAVTGLALLRRQASGEKSDLSGQVPPSVGRVLG